jgi:hypothetical protein
MATGTRAAIRGYLARIGSKGGKARAAKHSKATLSRWAKLGGRPPKSKADRRGK